MIQNKIEEFKINRCPSCGNKHNLPIDVFRNILPNNINKDIRVPIFKKINIKVTCPISKTDFYMDIMIQEDEFSKIVKLRRV